MLCPNITEFKVYLYPNSTEYLALTINALDPHYNLSDVMIYTTDIVRYFNPYEYNKHVFQPIMSMSTDQAFPQWGKWIS